MGIIKRQAIKSSIVSYFGVLIGVVNMLYIFPSYLEAKEIGLYRVLLSASVLFSSISLLGTSQLQIKFFSFFEKSKEKARFLSFNVVLALTGFNLFLFTFFLFKEAILGFYIERSPLVVEYYPYIFLITFFLGAFTFWSAYSRTQKRIVIPSLLREVSTRAIILVSILLYSFSILTFNGFLLSVVVAYALAFLIIFIYSNKLQAVRFSFLLGKIDLKMRKRMLKFAMLSAVTGVAGTLVGTIDSLMLSGLKDLDQTGIYTIAFFMGVIIEIPRRSLSQIAAPIVAKAWKDNDLEEIGTVYWKSSINQSVFGSFILLCLWLNVDYVFDIMPNGELYSQGKYVVLFIALGKLFDMIAGVNSEIISNSKYYYYNLYFIVFLAGATVLTNLYFIPIYGLNGAAFASLASLVLFNLIKLIFLYWRFRIQPFTIKTLQVFVLSIAILGLVNFVPELSNPWLNLILRLVIISAIYIPAILRLQVSNDINEMWKKVLRK